jgi:hypothetical protein
MKISSHLMICALLLALGSGCANESPEPPPGVAGMMAPPMTTPTGGVGVPPMVQNPIMMGPPPVGMNTMGTSGMGMVPAAGAAGASMAGMGGGAPMMTPEPAAGAGGAAAGSGAMAGMTGGPGFPQLPKVMTTDGPGPYAKVVKVMNTPPGGWLIYPEEIGKDGVKHPIFLFGPGGGTTPSTYETSGMHWDRYGSYGFVIYVLPRSTGDGAAMKAGLDWVLMQNDMMGSPLYQKLDTSKVCAAGHSQGSVTTFDFMPDDRVTTTIHISGGSFDGMGPSHLSKDTMFLCGPSGSADVAFPQCETDFANSKVPTFYTNIQGSDHLTSGRLGWAAIIAWMLWHLAGHEEWRKEFVEPTGKFHMGIYKSQIKNW